MIGCVSSSDDMLVVNCYIGKIYIALRIRNKLIFSVITCLLHNEYYSLFNSLVKVDPI